MSRALELMSYQAPRSTSYMRSQISSNRRSGGGTCAIWFSSGCIFGLIGGILLVIAAATFGATRIPAFINNPRPGDADLVVAVDERYINNKIAQRVNGSYATGIDGLTLTQLQVDLAPDNRMDLLAQFHANVMFVSVDIPARIDNRVSIGENGGLSLGMIGDPQIGDLNISLDLLPFDLKGTIRQAVNNVNNSLLISEINAAATKGTGFEMDSVATSDDALTVKLTER